jgi:tRNA(Ile)-lysidine synthase
MENSRNSDGTRSPPWARRLPPFGPDALADIFRDRFGLTPEIPLYVAYSGGMDSHVLLHAMAELRSGEPWRVAALHIDHGLHPDSRNWEGHCAAVCTDLNVPYQSRRVVVRDIAARGIEDAARRARYAALAELLPEGAVLLTAHHRTDQAETLLLQLLRGAGVPGLAGMRSIVPFARGRLARPLLEFERAALAHYAAEQRLRWIEDPSNADVGPARNYLRRRLWPVLVERWPGAAERLATTATHLAQADVLLDERGRMDAQACVDRDGALRIAALTALSPARRSNLLRYWLRARTGTAPPEPALRAILACAGQPSRTGHAAVTWAGIDVRRYRDRLSVIPPVVPSARDWEAAWDPNGVLDIPGCGWRLSAHAAFGAGVSQALVAGKELRVRTRRGGECCRLRGHRHKVKKLLQEAGIPPWERGHWPLVYADGDLVAVGDRWVCEPYAARAGESGWVLSLARTR